MKTKTDQSKSPEPKPDAKDVAKPKTKNDVKPNAKDDLKTLPLEDVEKKLEIIF